MAADGATDLTVAAADESRHTPSADPLWSESYYLNFSASDGVLGGFVRLALHPARQESEGLLCVYLPGGGVGITLLKGAIAPSGALSIRAGGLAMECVEPLRRWRVTFDGELHMFVDPSCIPEAYGAGGVAARVQVQLALDVEGLHVPVFYPTYGKAATAPPHTNGHIGLARTLRRAARRPREILLALRMRSGRHYEQSMRVSGTVAFDGDRAAFDGTGHRDHSWGLRDWSILQHLRWLSGQMDGFAFNAVYMTIAGTHVTNGYVWRDGRCTAVDEVQLENSFDAGGRAARDVRLMLRAGGEHVVITGDVLLNVPLPINSPGTSSTYTVGRTRFRCGDRTGYGVAEFLERLDP